MDPARATFDPPKRIRTAVIPAAGLGTRFLPATKAQAKELLPVAGKPLLQYAVEEAVASGIENIVLVTRPDKPSLEEHFHANLALERWLEDRGRHREAQRLRRLAEMVHISSVSQEEPRGLAHAIGCARPRVGDEPFAVLLPDTLVYSQVPCIGQLLEAYGRHGGCVVGIQEIDARECERYGMVAGEPLEDGRGGRAVLRVRYLVEKPKPQEAPSRYGIVGRYVLEPDIFTYLDQTPPDAGGESQITQSLALYARARSVFAVCIEGTAYDAGDCLGFLRANIEYALRDPQIGASVRQYLTGLKLE